MRIDSSTGQEQAPLKGEVDGSTPSRSTKICSRCHKEKPASEFHKKTGRWLQPQCKPCQSEYIKAWYANNKESHKSNTKRQRKERFSEIEETFNRLKAKPCMDCGRCFPSCAMDFDHVRGKKVMNVGVMVKLGYSLDKLLEEIAKCDVVCACCHRVRTNNRRLSRTSSAAA